MAYFFVAPSCWLSIPVSLGDSGENHSPSLAAVGKDLVAFMGLQGLRLRYVFLCFVKSLPQVCGTYILKKRADVQSKVNTEGADPLAIHLIDCSHDAL